MTDRYAGRPFLRLLECYVLDALGELDDAQRETLRRMEPKLTAVYGTPGSWRDVVAAQMEFPASLPDQIREIWTRNVEAARSRGQTAIPEDFARAFVDQNFPAAVG